MLYYRVLPQYDNFKRADGSILVGGELYTEKELNRYRIDTKKVIPVNVPKNKVFWCFGARFLSK